MLLRFLMRLCACCFLSVAGMTAIGTTPGRALVGDPDNYRELLSDLRPGDTLRLAPGEYRRGLPIHRVQGTAQSPIVIRGPASGEPAVFIARSGANTVSIVDAAHVHIRDLTLDGRGIPVDAVKAEGHARWAHHIALENLVIVNHGANQQNVGISTKCPAWGWVVRGNRIVGAGTGMYFGSSDGSAAFFDAVIEHNLVVDPLGYAIQIKHQHARPALDFAPRDRRVTVIRHNVLSKASGGSAGPEARPNLLVGHWPLSGPGSNDAYHIYGNVLLDNPHEALFQGEGNVALYSNVFSNRFGPAIHIQPHNDIPRSVRILGNTVIALSDGIVIRVNEKSAGHTQEVAGNAVFAARPITGGSQHENSTHALERIGALLAALPSGGSVDSFPKDEQLRCAPVPTRLYEGLTEGSCDFNGRSRKASYCGAYAGSGRNPGWIPALEIKPRTRCVPR